MEADDASIFVRRLREAGPDELLELMRTRSADLDVAEARQLLRNPHTGLPVIELLLQQRHLLSSYEVRKEIAQHPQTPEVEARRLVAGLFWRDLLEISGDARVRPRIRRVAERHLTDRLPGLAVGERVAIARRSGPLLVSQLRQDIEPRVISALLENPRLTEGALMPLVSSDKVRPEVLALVAMHPKWGLRHTIRAAVCRNRRAQTQVVLKLLPSLTKKELTAIVQDLRLAVAVRQRAGVLLGRG